MFNYIKQSRKILGMNSRNLEYIRPYNLKKAKRLADDKLYSKRILKKNELSVPALIAKIRTYDELDNFDWNSLPSSFALKPNRGFGGEGILIVYGKKKGRDDAWIKADRSIVTIDDLKVHIRNILDGSFSLAGTPDIAFFEERLKLLKLFKQYTYKGIPDIRVIVFNKVPVMAMMRIPTKESSGKANLQQGAIGVGIDLASGVTTTAVIGKGKVVEYVPGTRLLLSGIKIPYWNDILNLAVRAQEISGLGFLGADIAIDKDGGPMIVELNARPGLSIQIANLSGLKERLQKVVDIKIKTIKKGVRVGMDLFGGEVEEEIEEISGKKVISTVEKVKIIIGEEREKEIEAKIDTGANSTSIDRELARELGYSKLLDEFDRIDLSSYQLTPENEAAIKDEISNRYKLLIPDLEGVATVFSASGNSIRPIVKVNFILNGKQITSKVNISDRSNLKYPMIIGIKDLKNFLIEIK